MTADVADGERKGIGRNARIGTITQLRGALARARAAGWRVAVVWLAVVAGGQAAKAAFEPLGVRPALPEVAVGYLGYSVAAALAAGIGAAWACRLMTEPARWLRFDRALLEGAGLQTAMVLAFSGLNLAQATWVRPGGTSGASTLAGLGFAILTLAYLYATMRLTLWPLARVAGRRDVGPVQSWRLMRRATRGMILGYVVLLLPAMAVAITLLAGAAAAGATPSGGALLATEVVTAAFVVLAYGLSATVYTLRVENPATVAEVFD